MTRRIEGTVTIEGARLVFRNFSGAEGQYNREGDRNFGIILEQDVAADLESAGWPVKYLKAKEDGDVPQPWLKVKVKFAQGSRPPRCVMVTSRKKTTLSEDLVSLLDWSEIESADIMISPYNWEVNGNTGVTPYLRQIYATIRESELDLKYADVPDARADSAMSATEGVTFAPTDEDTPPWV